MLSCKAFEAGQQQQQVLQAASRLLVRLVVFVVVVVVISDFSAQLQSIRSRTTTITSLASSEYVPLPDVLLAGQELEECWEEEPEQANKGEES